MDIELYAPAYAYPSPFSPLLAGMTTEGKPAVDTSNQEH
jgi:hypothetical protein